MRFAPPTKRNGQGQGAETAAPDRPSPKARGTPGAPLFVQASAAAPSTFNKGHGADVGGPKVVETALRGVSHADQPLPHLDRIQAAFGAHDVGHVRAGVGGPAGAAAASMGAHAYAVGDRVAFRSAPDVKLAAHEAAHVVQQRAGLKLENGVGKPGDIHEQTADQVADAVADGRSAEHLLGAPRSRSDGSAGVQMACACGGTCASCGGPQVQMQLDPLATPTFEPPFIDTSAASAAPAGPSQAAAQPAANDAPPAAAPTGGAGGAQAAPAEDPQVTQAGNAAAAASCPGVPDAPPKKDEGSGEKPEEKEKCVEESAPVDNTSKADKDAEQEGKQPPPEPEPVKTELHAQSKGPDLEEGAQQPEAQGGSSSCGGGAAGAGGGGATGAPPSPNAGAAGAPQPQANAQAAGQQGPAPQDAGAQGPAPQGGQQGAAPQGGQQGAAPQGPAAQAGNAPAGPAAGGGGPQAAQSEPGGDPATMLAEAGRNDAIARFDSSQSTVANAQSRLAEISGREVAFHEDVDPQLAGEGRSASSTVSRAISEGASSARALVEQISIDGPTRISQALSQTKMQIETARDREKDAISAHFEAARAAAHRDANAALSQIDVAYFGTVLKNVASAVATIVSLAKKRSDTHASVTKTQSTQMGTLERTLAAAQAKVKSVGTEQGGEAWKVGQQYWATYHKGRINRKDSFTAGHLTDRRAEARKGAAIDTAKGYRESFQNEADNQAFQLGRSRPGHCGTVVKAAVAAHSSTDKAIDKLTAMVTSGLQKSLADAGTTRQQLRAGVISSRDGQIAALRRAEHDQRQTADDAAYMQEVAAEQAAHTAAAQLLETAANAATSIADSLDQAQAQLQGQQAPSSKTAARAAAAAAASVERGLDSLRGLLGDSLASSVASLLAHGGAANAALTNVGTQAGENARGQATSFAGQMHTTSAAAVSTFGAMAQGYDDSLTKLGESADEMMDAVISGLETSYSALNCQIGEGAVAQYDSLTKSFKGELEKLPGQIEQYACEAANKEQPAWKSVVAWVLIILIMIVATVLLGPLAAALGGGLLGAIMAGAIIGAISSMMIQALQSWSTGQKITVGSMLRAAAIGAIGGALGGAGGYWAAGASTFGSFMLRTIAVSVAVELSRQITQSIWDRHLEFSWQGFAWAIGFAILSALTMRLLGKLKFPGDEPAAPPPKMGPRNVEAGDKPAPPPDPSKAGRFTVVGGDGKVYVKPGMPSASGPTNQGPTLAGTGTDGPVVVGPQPQPAIQPEPVPVEPNPAPVTPTTPQPNLPPVWPVLPAHPIPAPTAKKPGPSPGPKPGPKPKPSPKPGPKPAPGEDEEEELKDDLCYKMLKLKPGINDSWHVQRPPMGPDGDTTVQAGAFRIDPGTPLKKGQDTNDTVRRWVRKLSRYDGRTNDGDDDAGHVIANRFGGTINYNSASGNLFPQNFAENQDRMRLYDKIVKEKWQEGCPVCVNINLNYAAGKLRPGSAVYTMMWRSVGSKKWNPPIPIPVDNP